MAPPCASRPNIEDEAYAEDVLRSAAPGAKATALSPAEAAAAAASRPLRDLDAAEANR